MDNIFKFLVGDAAVDNEQPAAVSTPTPVTATGDDKTAITEPVQAGSAPVNDSTAKPTDQSDSVKPVDSPVTEPAATTTPPPAADAHSDIPQVQQELPKIKFPEETDEPAKLAEPQASDESSEVNLEEIAEKKEPVEEVSSKQEAEPEEKKEEVIAKISETPENTNQDIDYSTTDAADDYIDRLDRKLQMKVYFTQAVSQELVGPTSPFANAFGQKAEAPITPSTQQASADGQKITPPADALADKLAALRNQLTAEVKPVIQTPPTESSHTQAGMVN